MVRNKCLHIAIKAMLSNVQAAYKYIPYAMGASVLAGRIRVDN